MGAMLQLFDAVTSKVWGLPLHGVDQDCSERYHLYYPSPLLWCEVLHGDGSEEARVNLLGSKGYIVRRGEGYATLMEDDLVRC